MLSKEVKTASVGHLYLREARCRELPLSRKWRKKEKQKKACRSGEEGERQREISDVLQSALDEVSELKRQRNQWIEKIKRF